MVKTILVTGSNGFIGRNLIEFYSNRYNILTLNRHENIQDKLIKKPDIIINAAASIYDTNSMFDTNICLVNTILEHTKKHNTKFIQIGSSAEYGKKLYPSKETDYLDPVTFYAGTKAAASMMCRSVAKEYNLPIFIVRPYSVYGNYEKPYRLFPRLYNAFTTKEQINISEGYHDFIYIKDFIKGLNLFVENDYGSNDYGDIINLGSGIQSSNIDVLQVFTKIFGFVPTNINLNEGFSKSFESKTWVCDIAYSQDKYRFKAEYSLENGILDFIKIKKEQKYDS